MKGLLKQQTPFVRFLLATRPKQRKWLLRHMTRDQVNVLSEIVNNVLLGVVVLSSEQKDRLIKKKAALKVIGNKSSSIEKRQRVIETNVPVVLEVLSLIRHAL